MQLRAGPHHRHPFGGALAAVALSAVLVGCGDDAGVAAGSAASGTGADDVATTVADQTEGGGEVIGSPDDIRQFTDPAGEIGDAADLTAYLLPGMSGPGVDCVADTIDVGEVLDNSREGGSWTAARVITGCVSDATFGRIIAMYATELGTPASLRYGDIERCVSREWATAGGANTTKMATVLEARLDLAGPVTSPDVAWREIGLTTGCLDDVDRVRDPSTTAPTTDTTTTDTSTSESAESGGSGSSLPSGARQTTWTFVTSGSCVLSLPGDDAPGTTLVPCEAPHGGEVVYAALGSEPAGDHCQRQAETYLAGTTPDWQADVVTITRDEPFEGVVRTVCIIGPSDGQKVTGSIRG
ncbi:MAG: hypothetical protein ACFCVK_14565 [Acidimicrobiales bacterium]